MELILDDAACKVRVGWWEHPARWILPPSALLELGPGRHMCIARVGDARCRIELWVGEPGQSDGLAVLGDDEPVAVTNIPMCSCGERECGHRGLQLSTVLETADLPSLAERLAVLPFRHVTPTRSDVWFPHPR